jgi:SAM-dependent methyltransferase
MSTTSREFFERMYSATEDPWSFASSEYEEQRYATILGFVPSGKFRSVFEPGCSIGELTVQLAERCGFVTAIDIAQAAVKTARQRCSHLTNVDVHQGSLADDIPAGPFDLIVFSEIGYYFTRSQLVDLAATLASRIDRGGQFLAVHWTGVSPDHLMSGESVHTTLMKQLPMEHLHHESHSSDSEDGFVLDLWQRPQPPGDLT